MKPRYRWSLVIFASLAVLLIVLNIALPFLVRDYLNDKLRDMDSYSGHVEDVDIALWRGAYTITGLKVTKVDGKVPIPLLDVPRIDIAVSWHSLWYDHAVVATAGFLQPTLNFVDGGVNKQASQTGAGTNWRAQLEKLLPITLNEVRVEDGKITFNNFNSKPPVKLEASKIDASLYNLTNVQNPEGKRDARFDGKGILFGQAPLDAKAAFDPLSNFENFEFRLRVTDIELKRINDFASAYGKFDFNAGHGDVVIQAQASKGKLNGYIKPLLRDVDVLNWQQDVENKDKGLLRSVWEALVGGTETVLKNQRKNQFATRVELSGDVHRLDISPLQAFLEILRNGFIQAFSARYEQTPASKD